MKFVNKFIYALYISIIFLNVSFAQSFSFKKYDSENGFNQQYVYKISQGYKRQLILSTSEGLSIFNGKKFKTLTVNQGLASNFCYTHIVDKNKNIWVGHFQNGISKIDSALKVKKLLFKELEFTKISNLDIYYKSQNEYQVIVGTIGKGIYSINQNDEIKKISDAELIYRVIVLNNILLSFNENGLEYINLNNNKILSKIDTIDGNEIETSCVFLNNAYVSVANKGIFKIDNQLNWNLLYSSNNYDQISDLFVDANQYLNVAIKNKKILQIALYNPQIVKNINEQNGLPSITIQSIYQDDEDGLWIGSFGQNLYYLNNERFVTTNKLKNVNCITSYTDKNIINYWYGTDDGLYNSQNSQTDFLEKLNNYQIKSIKINEEILYIGTENNGAFTYDIKTKKTLSIDKNLGITINNINDIILNKNDIYISTITGIYVISKNLNSYKIITTNEGLLHNNIFKLYIDKKSNMWCAAHGASLFSYNLINKKSNYYQNIKGLKLYKINSITEDLDNNICIATEGDGFFKFKNNNFVQYTEAQGLMSNYCYSIICDEKGTVWIAHKNGLSYIQRSKKYFNNITKSDGITITNFKLNAVHKDLQGNIYWGSSDGILTLLNKKKFIERIVRPQLLFESIKINNELLKKTDAILNLPNGKYDIAIDFAAVHFTTSDKIKYKIKLSGLQNKWIEQNNSEINYPQLGSGNYELEIIAITSNDIESDVPLKFKICIDTPFYKKLWFYVLTILISTFSIWLFIRLRLRQLKKQADNLRKIVNEQTLSLKNERNKLSIAYSELKVANTYLNDSINYASQIQQTIIPDNNLLNKVFTEHFIIYKPKDILSGDFYFLKQKLHYTVFAVIDCTGHGVPGALLSMLCNTILNNIIDDTKFIRADNILNQLNNLLFVELNRNNSVNSNFGLDISLIIIDKNLNLVQLSAAGRTIYRIHNNELQEYKGSIFSIGGLNSSMQKYFPYFEFSVNDNATYYLLSDGIVDQFNEFNNKKFLSKNLKLNLLKFNDLTLNEQKNKLQYEFETWQGSNVQTDDMLLVGLKI